MSLILSKSFRDFGAWRAAVARRIDAHRSWLGTNGLADAEVDLRLADILERVKDDRLTIAFVAEFSRGKSELINAIFFADYGRRLLPSSTGRTTMCPTELLWDPQRPPQLMLLPIETRALGGTTSEYKRSPEAWTTLALDVTSADALAAAFQRVRDTRLVSIEDAKRFGLFLGAAGPAGVPRADGLVEIPAWRHAIVNFPHPLLAQGLVILDTPGLNAIGTEPELTLNLLPNADAVLFILAMDTGVSQSDLTVWQDFIRPLGGQDRVHYAVLNKIDGLWDGIRSEVEIDTETDQQVNYCSRLLQLPPSQIFPVSAQRALVAKISADTRLLDRSRLPLLEHAVSTQLIPNRRRIIRASTRHDLGVLIDRTRNLLEARAAPLREQLDELRALKGRNLDVVTQMLRKVSAEKGEFERSLGSFQNLRREFSERSNALFELLGMEALNEEAKQTLVQVRRSRFTPGVRAAMGAYFDNCRSRLEGAARRSADIHRMMTQTYEQFSTEHRLRLAAPPPFSLARYQKEFERLERLYQKHFDTLFAMLTTEALTLLQKFFETIATQVRQVFVYANRETEAWLRAMMTPLDGQIRERQAQLRRRLDSIKRIHDSTQTLDDRIEELEHILSQVLAQAGELDAMAYDLEQTLAAGTGDDTSLPAAA